MASLMVAVMAAVGAGVIVVALGLEAVSGPW